MHYDSHERMADGLRFSQGRTIWNLIKTAGNNWKIWSGCQSSLWCLFVDGSKYVKSFKAAKKIEGVSGKRWRSWYSTSLYRTIMLGTDWCQFIITLCQSSWFQPFSYHYFTSREEWIMHLDTGTKVAIFVLLSTFGRSAWINDWSIPPALLLYYVYNIVYKSMYNTYKIRNCSYTVQTFLFDYIQVVEHSQTITIRALAHLFQWDFEDWNIKRGWDKKS